MHIVKRETTHVCVVSVRSDTSSVHVGTVHNSSVPFNSM